MPLLNAFLNVQGFLSNFFSLEMSITSFHIASHKCLSADPS